MVTPVKVEVLDFLLQDTEYMEDERNFITNGFRFGFPLEYHGPKDRKMMANNLKLRCGSLTQLWNKVIKEVSLGCYAGPFEEIPFTNYIQSPIGLVPKHKPGETRLIFHLSYPEGESVNDYTPKDLCTVKYKDLDQAIRLIQSVSQNCFVVKSDFKGAFRNLPIKPEDRKWLVMVAVHPVTRIKYFFIEKCLPFGSSISCSHFQRVSNAIEHIFLKRTGSRANNYLDDFLIAALIKALCDGRVQAFLDICEMINFPVSMEKTFWGEQIIIFLGMLIDTVNQMVLVPVDKSYKAVSLL